MAMMIGLLFILVVGTTASLTYAFKYYAESKQLLDIPNDRSSHSQPTPRGGGISFVFMFTFLLTICYFLKYIPSHVFLGFLGAGLLTAIIGFLDDKGDIPAKWRLPFHFIAAVWLLIFLGGFPAFPLLGFIIPSTVMTVFAVFYVVWLLNLYNFMDGIDGLAGGEAVSICLIAFVVCLIAGFSLQATLLFLLAACVAGFLVWNFPTAKIFMGDVGSGFLGIMLAGFTVMGAWQSQQLFFMWLILLGVFIIDATWTLVRRLIRGEHVFKAHRSHTYQRATQRFGGHVPVTLAVLLINLYWLAPIAFLVALNYINGVLGLVIAYTPLTLVAYYFDAGAAEQ